MYKEYKSVRGSVGLEKETLLPIDTRSSDQVCDVFGIHPNLPLVKELYDEKEALFFSGIGKTILTVFFLSETTFTFYV